MSCHAICNGNITLCNHSPLIATKLKDVLRHIFALENVDIGDTFIEVWGDDILYDEEKMYRALNKIKDVVEIKKDSALNFRGEDGTIWMIKYDGVSWEEFQGNVYYEKPGTPSYERLKEMFLEYIKLDLSACPYYENKNGETVQDFTDVLNRLDAIGCTTTDRRNLGLNF